MATHHNSVLPSKVGEIQRLGDERVTSCDITGNEDYDRKQPARDVVWRRWAAVGGGGRQWSAEGSSQVSEAEQSSLLGERNEQRPHQKLKSWKNLDRPDQFAMTDD